MRALGDLVLSALGAALAWAAYKLLGHPGWALAFLAAYTALFLWLRRRDTGAGGR